MSDELEHHPTTTATPKQTEPDKTPSGAGVFAVGGAGVRATNPFATAALHYAQNGVGVVALSPNAKVARKGSHGVHDATTTPETIAGWWTQHPTANVGVACGAGSGVVVLDVDPKNAGDKTLAELIARNGALPPTPTATTPSGGTHYYFQHARGLRSGVAALGAGLDVLDAGRYAVAPPSRTNAGRYAWGDGCALGELPLAPLPGWMVEQLRASAPSSPSDCTVWTQIPDGQRGDTLFKIARALHDLGADASAIDTALHETNRALCVPPVEPARLRGIGERATKLPRRFVVPASEPTDLTQLDASAAELLAFSEPPPAAVLGDGLLRRGAVGLLHGAGGARKSYAALHLVAAVAAGRDWFGHPTIPGGAPAGYVSLEDNAWLLRDRLGTVLQTDGIDPDALTERLFLLARPWFSGRLDLLDPTHRQNLADWVRSRGLALCVLDYLARAHELETELDLRPVMSAAEAVAEETNAVLLLLHHDRKGQPGQRGIDRGAARGDSRLTDRCRFVMGATEIGERVRLGFEKTTNAYKPPPIWLEHPRDSGLVVTTPPQRSAEAAEAARARLLELVHAAGSEGVTLAALAAELERSPKTVRRYLDALGAQIRADGSGALTRFYPANP